jgi:hypothetical protein
VNVEIKCVTCGYHAATASERASHDKSFLKAAYVVMSSHTRETAHCFWSFGGGVVRKLP